MLVIRKPQLDVLAAPTRERFENRARDHLMERYPAETKALGGKAAVSELIRKGVEKAACYGINSQRDVLRFIELMIEIDPGFDELEIMKWSRAILDNPALSGKAKMALISHHQMLRTGIER